MGLEFLDGWWLRWWLDKNPLLYPLATLFAPWAFIPASLALLHHVSGTPAMFSLEKNTKKTKEKKTKKSTQHRTSIRLSGGILAY
jgi:hypothetical protein